MAGPGEVEWGQVREVESKEEVEEPLEVVDSLVDEDLVVGP